MSGMLDITDNLVDGQVRPSRRRAHPRRRGSLPGGRGRQGHGDVVRHRQRDLGVVRLLARRRVRVRRLGRLRPQEARHHRARRLGVGQAPLPRARPRRRHRAVHRRRRRRHVGRRVRQRHAAVGPDPAGRPRSTTATSSSTPTPTRPSSFAERQRLYDLPGSSWDDYDRAKISAGGGVFPLDAKSIPLGPELRARARPRRRDRRAAAGRADAARSCARRSTCSGTAASAPA